MTVRHTTMDDLPQVMQMYDYSRGIMRQTGNRVQWVGYPTEDDVLRDIGQRASYLVCDGQVPIATFAVVDGEEPTYSIIDHGRWIDASPYSTVHRLAKTEGATGVADLALGVAKERCAHLRIDTHHANTPMRHIVAKHGFVYCGVVYMDDGSPRDAYEWWRYDVVPTDIKRFVEDEVLPRYSAFDPAHRQEHARRVIARAMLMQPSPETYVAAAMHDLGLAEGREQHHLASGAIVRQCSQLAKWFSREQIETIAQAVEDHRASAKQPPRSHLGCVIAEADRDVEPETIVRRTVEYGIGHYPQLDREGRWQRTLQHLDEKYSEHGYIKLWLVDSPNAQPLAELRALISDRARLRALFNQIIEQLWI